VRARKRERAREKERESLIKTGAISPSNPVCVCMCEKVCGHVRECVSEGGCMRV